MANDKVFLHLVFTIPIQYWRVLFTAVKRKLLELGLLYALLFQAHLSVQAEGESHFCFDPAAAWDCLELFNKITVQTTPLDLPRSPRLRRQRSRKLGAPPHLLFGLDCYRNGHCWTGKHLSPTDFTVTEFIGPFNRALVCSLCLYCFWTGCVHVAVQEGGCG